MSQRRNHQLKLLLNDEELEVARELTELSGLSRSDWLRQLIRSEKRRVKAFEAMLDDDELPALWAPV